jgi:hypothetical protein
MSKPWNFKPLKTSMCELALVGGSAGLNILALSYVFNPVALGLAGLVSCLYLIPAPLEKKTRTSPLDSMGSITGERAAQIKTARDRYSDLMGMEHRPRLQFGHHENINDGGANLEMNYIELDERLERKNPSHLDFVQAHEHVHIGTNQPIVTKMEGAMLISNMTALCFWPYQLFVSAFGVQSLSILSDDVSLSRLGLLGLSWAAAAVGICTASRMAETICDRGALYLTQNLEAAVSYMKTIPPDRSLFSKLMHPVPETRIRNLEKAWLTMPKEQADNPGQNFYSPK